MKTLGILMILSLLAPAAKALDGYRSEQMTCADLQSVVQRDGEITVLHRIGSMTFYADKARCDEFPYPAMAVKGYEPSSDQRRCFVGWQCYFTGN